ncbi:MAG: 3-isopropylmalate dehydratase small subunit [Candidatus Kaiserbacteria bacterium GW2011_GWA2_49_19]|uniref:3-isopropylmalate dehydratase small subunit n=1 Tax=Candidatus Kaiserbacteria bacterium GW2011_GWA2_49_19 TaxID=1618669 RepID=A0A0G1VQI9_9BACT|nr:MAG: 3-isopropylmalate dehydratase small subunit [Candidatus Kaiserbacteria bacterium GW2011_GWA2_49_19]
MKITQFKNLSSSLMPLHRDDVDTDQIIPARYLTATDKKGFGEHLFMDLRFEEDGVTPKPDFALNQKQYKNAKILLAHENFGCGSSREHAPWALLGYGFNAVIAISFADIFRNNSAKNGLLVVELPRDIIDMMHADVLKDPKEKATINLEQQTSTWKGKAYNFPINPFVKKCMLEGLDDIGYTMSFADQISAYEKRRDGVNIN